MVISDMILELQYLHQRQSTPLISMVRRTGSEEEFVLLTALSLILTDSQCFVPLAEADLLSWVLKCPMPCRLWLEVGSLGRFEVRELRVVGGLGLKGIEGGK
jgi:hypothetical protein